jgi:hypothetical protein
MKSSRCIICLIYSKCSAGYECGGCMKYGGSSGWNLSSGSSKESASGNILETASSGSNRGRIVSVSKRSNRSKRSNMCIGAITVEYAIIFPIVILCILLLIYIGMLYYQQSLLQSIVSDNVQNCALLWGFNLEDIDIKEGIEQGNQYTGKQLYWHIFSNTNKKKDALIESIRNEIAQKSILKPEDEVDVRIEHQNYLFYKKVGISASLAYPLPFKSILESFGLLGNISIEAYSEMVINDPKEFMQNVDYIYQIYDETGAKDWVDEKCEPLANSLQKIKEYFK